MSSILRTAIAAGFVGLATQASALQLPAPNVMSTGQYGDFYVYSLDLLKSCSVSDPRCQPFVGDPPQLNEVDSSAGKIADKIVIYADASGTQLVNYDNASGPFANMDPTTVQVDNNFQPPTGTTLDFDMSAAGEPAEPGGGGNASVSWTGDVAGRWDAKLSSITNFLNGADLVFLFDNNQEGTDANQQQYFWGRVDILDGPAGNIVQSYCLNSQFQFGVFSPVPGSTEGACSVGFTDATYTTVGTKEYILPGDEGSFVGSGGRFCVDKTSGESFLLAGGVLPSNEGDCAAENGYFVSNNLGASSAEFAAYVPHLNANLLSWASAGYFMQIDFKIRGLNDGGEKLWIVGVNIPEQIPAPGTLALIGLGLFGLAGAMRRKAA